jgi:hypothetical protein
LAEKQLSDGLLRRLCGAVRWLVRATGKFHFSKKEKQKKRTLAFARGR